MLPAIRHQIWRKMWKASAQAREDALGDATVAILEAWDRAPYRVGSRQHRDWMLAIARKAVARPSYRAARSAKRERDLETFLPVVPDHSADPEASLRLRRVLTYLTPAERVAVLVRGFGATYEELGVVLGLSGRGAHHRYARVVQKIRQQDERDPEMALRQGLQQLPGISDEAVEQLLTDLDRDLKKAGCAGGLAAR
ncbi:MAG: hypothetical protein AAFV53_21060 [Myxococcota bacterium]